MSLSSGSRNGKEGVDMRLTESWNRTPVGGGPMNKKQSLSLKVNERP